MRSDLGVRWVEADALQDVAEIRRICVEEAQGDERAAFTILVDVSGNREPGVLLSILERFDRLFPVSQFIVKNFKLACVVSASQVYAHAT